MYKCMITLRAKAVKPVNGVMVLLQEVTRNWRQLCLAVDCWINVFDKLKQLWLVIFLSIFFWLKAFSDLNFLFFSSFSFFLVYIIIWLMIGCVPFSMSHFSIFHVSWFPRQDIWLFDGVCGSPVWTWGCLEEMGKFLMSTLSVYLFSFSNNIRTLYGSWIFWWHLKEISSVTYSRRYFRSDSSI